MLDSDVHGACSSASADTREPKGYPKPEKMESDATPEETESEAP
jgi:hypothetical protein